MFKNFSAALKLVKNLDNIKAIVDATYVALTKTLAVLVYLGQQVNDTKLGLTLLKYLPKVVSALTIVKNAIEKYGKYVGFTPSVNVEVQDAELLKDLDRSLEKLNNLIK